MNGKEIATDSIPRFEKLVNVSTTNCKFHVTKSLERNREINSVRKPMSYWGANVLYHVYHESEGVVTALTISTPSDSRLCAKAKNGSQVAFACAHETPGATPAIDTVFDPPPKYMAQPASEMEGEIRMNSVKSFFHTLKFAATARNRRDMRGVGPWVL
jgi:hypothetical protein